MNLGKKIRELRKNNNLTQEQFATAMNISPQAVSKWEMEASYPEMSMIPIIASFFKISLDELFEYDIKDIDEEIDKMIMEKKKFFWSDFNKAEQILLDGLRQYPASIKLKTELFDLYSYNLSEREDILSKAFDLADQIIASTQDVFCLCRTKENLIRIYLILERENGEDHYEEIKRIIESLPYIYPYMIQDRMRLSASYIKGEEGMKQAKELKDIEWQELFIACWTEGNRFVEINDYANALNSYEQSVDVIERFMYRDKKPPNQYPICGTQANHAMTVLSIAMCKYKLGKLEEIDYLIEKAKQVYFYGYGELERSGFEEMRDYFIKEYKENKLDEYKPLHPDEIEKYYRPTDNT